jgi:multicomponent Na+:H+ antiporter subunit E
MRLRFWEGELKKLVLILFSFVVWLLLTWSFDGQHLAVGAVVSILTGFIFGDSFIHEPAKLFQPKRWFWALVYIPVFLWELIKANLDVAYRVIHPLMPIHPGIVKVKTNIKSETGRVFLANSITLTPGTFTIDMKDDVLYIHWINVRHTHILEASEDIVSHFEPYLIKIFD